VRGRCGVMDLGARSRADRRVVAAKATVKSRERPEAREYVQAGVLSKRTHNV
jgi:hypothetical protein